MAAVICLLSIVGGVEVNPGKDDLEIPLVSILQNIWEVNISFLHQKLPLPKVTDVNLNIVQRDVLINSLDAESRRMPHASGNSPVPTSSSQISETESFDVLELAPKFSKLSGERPSEFI